MAHIFATVWAIYWQDIGRTAHIIAVYGLYVAPAPKPNIGHTVSHIMSTFVPFFFFYQSVGHIISIMWENYGPYSTETSEPHMAHILGIHCPQIFLRGNYLNRKFFWFRQNKVFVSPMELDSIIKTSTTFVTFFIIMKIFLLKQSSAFMQARTEKMHCEKYELIVPLLDQ